MRIPQLKGIFHKGQDYEGPYYKDIKMNGKGYDQNFRFWLLPRIRT